ncbi:MAG: DUF2793 domain-containing protein [Pseudomonadota bacterium]
MLGLPLLDAAQAQKHVTVNEALSRLDAGVAVTADGVGIDTPPSAVDGSVYVIGDTPTGEWSDHAGEIAFGIGGGWAFITPTPGKRLTDGSDGRVYVYDGFAWRDGLVAGSTIGAFTAARLLYVDETLSSGISHVSAAVIPQNAIVIGVTGRVIEEIVGPATWTLGVAGATDRYGSGLGTAVGSYALGATGSPLAYYTDTPIELHATGGSFSAGRVLIAIHVIEISPPVAL